MACEVCGASGKTVKARIEGTVLSACTECSKHGQIVKSRAAAAKTAAEHGEPSIQVSQIAPDFASRISKARESRGLTRDDLAKKINEKTSVIERAERGSRPDDRTAKKLESALNIKLLGYEEEDVELRKTSDESATIGDVASIKKK